MYTFKACNKKIIATIIILGLSTFGGAIANTYTSSTTFEALNINNAPSKEWEIVKALGGYKMVELYDYSINHH